MAVELPVSVTGENLQVLVTALGGREYHWLPSDHELRRAGLGDSVSYRNRRWTIRERLERQGWLALVLEPDEGNQPGLRSTRSDTSISQPNNRGRNGNARDNHPERTLPA